MNKRFMEIALKIAFERLGMTSPNPPVGAVIVKDGKIISTGGTGGYGESHAEVVAIKNAGLDIKGAGMYVTLEPCNYYGKTPPCTRAIIQAGISRVYLPILDPNPRVAGKGVAELKDAGIEVVIMNEMSDYAVDLIRQFKKYILINRPFIISKSAVTLDGRIATKTGDSKWVSSEYSRYIVHKLRAKVDAVIVGKNTFVNDNPRLDVRFDTFSKEVSDYFSKNITAINGRENFFLRSLLSEEIRDFNSPLRVVIGLPGNIDMNSPIFSDENFIFFERREKYNMLTKENDDLKEKIDKIQLRLIDTLSPLDEIGIVMDELSGRGIMLAMLEGGGRLAGSFF